MNYTGSPRSRGAKRPDPASGRTGARLHSAGECASGLRGPVGRLEGVGGTGGGAVHRGRKTKRRRSAGRPVQRPHAAAGCDDRGSAGDPGAWTRKAPLRASVALRTGDGTGARHFRPRETRDYGTSGRKRRPAAVGQAEHACRRSDIGRAQRGQAGALLADYSNN